MRCCAEKAGSSTTSPPSRIRTTRPSSGRSSRTRGSRRRDRSARGARRGRRPHRRGRHGAVTSFPGGDRQRHPSYATAIDPARYVGEPSRSSLPRSLPRRGRCRARRRRLRAARRGARPVALRPIRCTSASSTYGDADAALRRAPTSSSAETFHFPRFTLHADRVLRGRRRLGRDRAGPDGLGELPGAVHAARRRGGRARAPGDRLRLLTPPDSGGSFGIKSSVFAYIMLMGLASRQLGVPVTWIEDRLEHLAASAAATGRATDVEAAFTADGELIALRYDAIEDVGAYVRAPEPATLYRMHGSLSGAYSVPNVAVRNRVVLTNTLPPGPNRGFGGPQLYFGLERTMAIAARRLGLDPAELARPQPDPGRRDAVPHAVGRRSTTPATTPRCLDQALELADYDGAARERRAARAEGGSSVSASPASSTRRSRTWATSRSPRRPRSGAHAAQVGERRRRDRSRSIRAAGSRCGWRPTPQGQGHRTVCRAGRRRRARLTPDDMTVLSRWTPRRPVDGRLGQLLVALLRRRRGAARQAAARSKLDGRRSMRSARSTARRADDSVSLRRLPDRALEPGRAAGRDGAGSRGRRFWARADLEPPDDEDRIASSQPTASSSTSAPSRSTGRRVTSACSTTSPSTTPGRLINPLLADGQVMRRIRPRARRGAVERHGYDE